MAARMPKLEGGFPGDLERSAQIPAGTAEGRNPESFVLNGDVRRPAARELDGAAQHRVGLSRTAGKKAGAAFRLAVAGLDPVAAGEPPTGPTLKRAPVAADGVAEEFAVVRV